MTLDELKMKGYRFSVGLNHWAVYHGRPWISRLVANGKLNSIVNINEPSTWFINDKKAIKAAIGATTADLVKRRINGEKV